MSNNNQRTLAQSLIGWAILIVPVLLMFLLYINPLREILAMSTTKWNGIGPASFVGLDNYARLFGDERFLGALANTFFSPILILRALFLVAASLGLALLFMELGSGFRITLHSLLTPLIIFSGAALTGFLYFMYFSPLGGLGAALAGEGSSPIADPMTAPGVLQNLFLANGLAWALPLLTALFLGAARGARLMLRDPRTLYREFWSRAVRLIIVLAVGAIGFSLAGLEAGKTFRLPMDLGANLITYYYEVGFLRFNLGYGAAAVQVLIAPLVLLGLGMMLLLEVPRARISFRLLSRAPGKPAAGVPWGTARIVGVTLAGVCVIGLLAALVIVIILPWLSSLSGLGGMGASRLTEESPLLISGLLRSYAAAIPAAIMCLIVTAAAGFAIGYLRPWGHKIALIIMGAYIFLSPALLLIPYYMTFRALGLIDTLLAQIIPCLISPLGIVLFSLFFRGVRDERDALKARGADSTGFAARAISGAALFSIPLIAIYLLSSLNQTMLPITMINRAESANLPVALLQLQGNYMMGGSGFWAGVAQISFIQYLPPLALLVTGVIAVFPRLALVVRKKGEEPPAPETEAPEQTKGEA